MIRKKKQDERKEDLANFVQTVFVILYRNLLRTNLVKNNLKGEEI